MLRDMLCIFDNQQYLWSPKISSIITYIYKKMQYTFVITGKLYILLPLTLTDNKLIFDFYLAMHQLSSSSHPAVIQLLSLCFSLLKFTVFLYIFYFTSSSVLKYQNCNIITCYQISYCAL